MHTPHLKVRGRDAGGTCSGARHPGTCGHTSLFQVSLDGISPSQGGCQGGRVGRRGRSFWVGSHRWRGASGMPRMEPGGRLPGRPAPPRGAAARTRAMGSSWALLFGSWLLRPQGGWRARDCPTFRPALGSVPGPSRAQRVSDPRVPTPGWPPGRPSREHDGSGPARSQDARAGWAAARGSLGGSRPLGRGRSLLGEPPPGRTGSGSPDGRLHAGDGHARPAGTRAPPCACADPPLPAAPLAPRGPRPPPLHAAPAQSRGRNQRRRAAGGVVRPPFPALWARPPVPRETGRSSRRLATGDGPRASARSV